MKRRLSWLGMTGLLCGVAGALVGAHAASAQTVVGGLRLDAKAREATLDGVRLDLTPEDWVIDLIDDSPIASVISNPRLPDNPVVACNEAFVRDHCP